MPKRSLGGKNSGQGKSTKIELKKIDLQEVERLNLAVDEMFGAGVKVSKTDEGIAALLQVAVELRSLPREGFKASLKDKFERRKNMATMTETKVNAQTSDTKTSAVPRLAFRDAGKAIEFYKRALGAKETFRFEAGGSIPAAEIKIGESQIMLSEEWPEGGRFSAETLGFSPVQMSMQVADVDSFAESAVAAGMKLARPVADQFYGHRDVLLSDPFGYSWTVYSVTEEMSVEEMHRRMQGMTAGPESGRMPGQSEKGSGVNPVPRGFRTVTPYLVAENGLELLDFVKAAFEAEETERVIMPNGGVHGETRIGDSMLMIGGGTPGHKFASTLHPQALHVYVENAEEVCRKAVVAGATLIDDVRNQEYGERSGTVKDKAGNLWYVATAKGETFTPKGLHAVNPYLHPLRAEPFIAFLKRAFEAEEVAKYASPDGVVHHAQVKIGDAVIEMGEAQGKYERMPAMFYLYVPDSDALYKRALAAGAKSLHEPKDQPYGDRNSAVTDGFGNIWYIATHVKDIG